MYFLTKKSGFTKKASFGPMLITSSINSKLRIATLSFFMLAKLRTTVYINSLRAGVRYIRTSISA